MIWNIRNYIELPNERLKKYDMIAVMYATSLVEMHKANIKKMYTRLGFDACTVL